LTKPQQTPIIIVMNAEKKQKLDAMVNDLVAVARKHHIILDRYHSKEKGVTEYFFKLQFEDVEISIDKVFSPVHHGDPMPHKK
jgi:hypothetical protein